jgi:hypothetical protein
MLHTHRSIALAREQSVSEHNSRRVLRKYFD